MTNKTKKFMMKCVSKALCSYRENRKLLMNAIYCQFTKRREINGGIGAQFKYAIEPRFCPKNDKIKLFKSCPGNLRC